MAQPALVPAPDPKAMDHDDIVVLRGATWADFERILAIRGDDPVPRLTYLEGQLELISPSKSHESIKSVIGRLVEAWCMEKGVDINPYGSWTLKDARTERGAEPDECYVLGEDEDEGGRERPDLAIEVVWTSGGVNKLEVYRKLAVREVWIHQKGQFHLYALRGEQYEPITRSQVLPDLDLDQLAQFVPIRPMTRAVRAYRDALGR